MRDDRTAWDRAAADYQRVFRLGQSEYQASLLRYWEQSGMIFPGARVLDVGCGVGKYGRWLAERGFEVTLLDSSGEMLRHARDNMAACRTPWTLVQADFNEISGHEPALASGFDLVISTMSGAIHDADTLRVFSALSRGWCFLARFCAWRQPLRDELLREMHLELRSPVQDPRGDCARLLRLIQEAGYSPALRVVDYRWSDRRSSTEMAERLCHLAFAERADADALRDMAERLALEKADDEGFVNDAVDTRVAWIRWKGKAG